MYRQSDSGPEPALITCTCGAVVTETHDYVYRCSICDKLKCRHCDTTPDKELEWKAVMKECCIDCAAKLEDPEPPDPEPEDDERWRFMDPSTIDRQRREA